MMAMLILWLKKIILLVLLATFLDLLLPSGTYSKYVKLVMGLLILLALLSPILNLFRKDIPLAQLSYAVGENATQSPDFARVDALAKKLAAENDEQANRYAEAQIGELVKKQIETQHGVKVQNVQVRIRSEGEKAKQPIDYISVILTQRKPTEEAEAQNGREVLVEPMKPVKVEISPGSGGESIAEKDESVAVVAEQTRMEKTIAAEVSHAWNVPNAAVRITWTGTGEEG